MAAGREVERRISPTNIESQWPIGTIEITAPGALPKKDDQGNHTHNILDLDIKDRNTFVNNLERVRGLGNLVDSVVSGDKKLYYEVGSGVVVLFVVAAAAMVVKPEHWHDARHFFDTAFKAGSPTIKAARRRILRNKKVNNQAEHEFKPVEYKPHKNGNSEHLH